MLLAILYLGSFILMAFSGSGYGDATTQTGNLFFTLSPWIIGGSILWMIVMVFSGKNMILSLSGAHPIKKSDAPELYRIVENLAIRTGIKTPRVFVMEDDSLNAFATGYSPDKAAVTVTRGILKKLIPAELEAVLAHEFGHIINRDTRTMLVAITMTGIIQLIADMILRSLWFSGRSRGGRSHGDDKSGAIVFLAIIAVWIIGFIGAILVQLGISRKRELLADAESAYLTRNPQGLITALEKITADPRVEQLDGKRSIAALCIADPLEAGNQSLLDSLQSLFGTHPSTKNRIKELRRMMVAT
ncbi:hypothetical protein A3H22_01270 [Candidatus Peribacteria bacterium RIFCSPLOWO2_12_FULL_55_15]|nr:MAG: hypothetical protein A2789_02070 [Candidatus Peribacteria bacterium RIFCSPHIGHO2_01_FULL_54_22]OGJ63481.1 MAG: hypothetical protein A3D12_01865 [Candidatus Peribacteria bacterium RIFCSPHIGHO2_02_FULL_55_24]OGJ67346.1 MAG: hypothetical protein A2947_04140 [Candidatus Peribacteria bacterium RIFCSPLOWO2_01_FULL_54_110]OGJ68750.1 MAG: hypothetical protein A3H90_00225 [Candidatus Peribacteria bacterium RIFCSPLOWO2_02_FULL_55_36]OGJ71035.1 MAG: hypothetical protein A3H22_01270 [Candidatus Per